MEFPEGAFYYFLKNKYISLRYIKLREIYYLFFLIVSLFNIETFNLSIVEIIIEKKFGIDLGSIGWLKILF